MSKGKEIVIISWHLVFFEGGLVDFSLKLETLNSKLLAKLVKQEH